MVLMLGLMGKMGRYLEFSVLKNHISKLENNLSKMAKEFYFKTPRRVPKFKQGVLFAHCW